LESVKESVKMNGFDLIHHINGENSIACKRRDPAEKHVYGKCIKRAMFSMHVVSLLKKLTRRLFVVMVGAHTLSRSLGGDGNNVYYQMHSTMIVVLETAAIIEEKMSACCINMFPSC
jgi:hypothetical protein